MNIQLGSIYCDKDGYPVLPMEEMKFSNYACVSLINGRLIYLIMKDYYHLASKTELEQLKPENIRRAIIGIFTA